MISTSAVAEVREAFDRCRRRYPSVELPFEQFLARVERAGLQIAAIQCEDLFLATACTQGNRIAWELFAEEYLAAMRAFGARACRNDQEGDDLAQQVIAALMGNPGKLGGYDGRGSLSGWLRVAVAHAAVDRFRRASRNVSLEEMRDDTAPAPKTGERIEDRADARWGQVICGILVDEIRRLPARDRLLLSLYYLQSVPLKLIGAHFQVHESTASRWLDRLRGDLKKSVERELHGRHGLKKSEIDSLWVWASEFEGFSLEKALGALKASGCKTDALERQL